MPVKRRNAKARPHRITPEAVEAFRAGDYMALHHALGLAPWEASPLPASITPLGVDPNGPKQWRDGQDNIETWSQAVELQRELQAAAGTGTA